MPQAQNLEVWVGPEGLLGGFWHRAALEPLCREIVCRRHHERERRSTEPDVGTAMGTPWPQCL